MRKLDYTILELMESTAKNIKAQPVNLGGVSGSAGGAGGPPGGFIGYLPQTRVAYDIDEIASSGITSSGTLLDNLNHIRYRLQILEAGTLIVDELDGVPTVSGVNRITFSGGATVTDAGGGHVIIGITASGGGGGIPEAPSDGNVYGRRNATWADLDTYYVPYIGATTDVNLGTYHITTGDSNSLGNTDIKQGKNIHLGTSQSDNNYIGFGDGDAFGPYVKLLEINDDCFGVRIASTTGAVLIAGYRSDYSNIETMLGDIDAYDHGNYLKINENGAEFNTSVNIPTGQTYNINGTPHTHGATGLAEGYIFGYGLSNNGTDATNDIDITKGKCRDSSNADDIVLATGLTGKQLDAAWAVGSSAGLLDQGSIADATYHVHAIKRSDTGVVDVIASLSHDKSSVCTMTIASPAVVTMGVTARGHGLVAGSPIKFSTTGALPTGVTAGTQYYVIAAGLTETQFRFSTSNGGAAVNTSGSQSGTHTCLPGPKLPTNYSYFRRIFSIVRTGGTILGVRQEGDWFMWKVPVADVAATNPGTSAVTRTLTVPVGITVQAYLAVLGYGTAAASQPGGIYISDLALTDTAAAGGSVFNVGVYVGLTGTTQNGAMVLCFTNNSAQVRSRIEQSAAATRLYIATNGYMDTRGRLS